MMIIPIIIGVVAIAAIAILSYQYSNSLVEVSGLKAALEDKETIAAALRAHVKRLEGTNENLEHSLKVIKSELQSCNDKAKAAKAKAAKANQTTVVVESKPKRTYNKKSK